MNGRAPYNAPHILFCLFFILTSLGFFPHLMPFHQTHMEQFPYRKSQAFAELSLRKAPLEFGLRISAGVVMLKQQHCDK